MADNEYIKRSEVVALIEDKLKRCEIVLEALDLASLRTKVMGLRSADVAPRAEVAEELINMALSKIQIMISAIKAQEGNGIITEFNGGAKTALEIVFKDLAELKNEYTEAEPPKGD